MKKFKQFASIAVLTLTLTSSTFAGIISGDRSGKEDVSGSTSNAAYSDTSGDRFNPMTASLLSILQSILSFV